MTAMLNPYAAHHLAMCLMACYRADLEAAQHHLTNAIRFSRDKTACKAGPVTLPDGVQITFWTPDGRVLDTNDDRDAMAVERYRMENGEWPPFGSTADDLAQRATVPLPEEVETPKRARKPGKKAP